MSIIEYSADLDTAEPPPPLPVGTYPATIEGAEVKESKSTGNSYVALTLRIHPEAYPADFAEGEPDGILVSYNRVTVEDTPSARYRMRKLRETCGLRPGGKTMDTNDFVGLVVNIATGHDTYEGVTRTTCEKIIGV